MLDLLILAVSLGSARAGQCAEPPRIASGVAALHGDLVESEAFTLAEIQAMSQQSRETIAHPALGFYRATFGYEASAHTVTEVSPDGTRCGTLTTIMVRLMLHDRAVVIASDLRQRGCDHDAVVQHYRKHATADDKALSEGVQVLNKALVSAWPTIRERLPSSGAPDEADLRAAIRPVLAKSIAAVERLRTAAAAKVDTADDVLALTLSCTTHS